MEITHTGRLVALSNAEDDSRIWLTIVYPCPYGINMSGTTGCEIPALPTDALGKAISKLFREGERNEVKITVEIPDADETEETKDLSAKR